jgi:hypothetical protein
MLTGRPVTETVGVKDSKSWLIQLPEWHLILTFGVATIALLAFFVRLVLLGRILVHGNLGGVMLPFSKRSAFRGKSRRDRHAI